MAKRWILAAVMVIPWTLAATQGAPAPADKNVAKGEKAEYKVYNSYFVSNKAGIKDGSTYKAFADQKSFDEVFRPTPPLIGKKREYLPRDVFDTKIVAAVIKKGNKMVEYKVEKVTVDKDTLYVQYTTKSMDTPATTFAASLIVAVDKGKIASVIFLEDGKKAGTAKLEK
jgi:hypothetical protein